MQKQTQLVLLFALAVIVSVVALLLVSPVNAGLLTSNSNRPDASDFDAGVGSIPEALMSRIHSRRSQRFQAPIAGSQESPAIPNSMPRPSPPSVRSPLQPSNVSVADVYDYGAVGDGSTDDTTAFQNALNFISSAGGGTVIAPRGYFLFKGNIDIPAGVTLQGTYTTVPSHPMAGQDHIPLITGTLLMPTAGRNNENGTPFITLHRDSTVRGLVIYYPDQPPRSAPVPYPWSIDLTSDNAAVLDIESLNSWNLIRANGSARHYISRVQGQPINIGVYIDQTYDIGRVENVHFNPWYSFDKTFLNWQLSNGRAFVVARSDWEYFFNTFAFGYSVGYHFIASSAGSCNGNFLGIGADMAVRASVLVDNSDVFGILISNGEFTSFVDASLGNFTDVISTQVVVNPSNRGSVRFVNTAFWGPSYHIAQISGSGTVGFGDCTFCQWDAKNQGRYAITVNGTGNLLVRGCEFQQVGNQIQLGTDVKKSVITGNIIQGALKIADGGGKAVVGLNAHD